MLDDLQAIRHAKEFRRCLVEIDVDAILRLQAHVSPHLPTLTRQEALYSIHLARTKMNTLPRHLKTYSQRWLNERRAGSFMPDDRRGH